MVMNDKPIIIVTAMGSQVTPPHKYNGIKPKTVVNVANK